MTTAPVAAVLFRTTTTTALSFDDWIDAAATPAKLTEDADSPPPSKESPETVIVAPNCALAGSTFVMF
jgi:hypothetical protein